MTAPSLTEARESHDSYRQSALYYEDSPTAESIQGDLEISKLGGAILALLALAQEVDDRAAKREAEHVQNHRRYMFQARPEERLAEQLLNLLGSPEDAVVIRQIAERLAQ